MKVRPSLIGPLAIPLLALGLAGPEVPVGFQPRESDRKIHLKVDRASVERFPNFVLFRCVATLVNEAGAPIEARSNFFSAFDGLELVVLGEAGEKLFQQPYTYHQSPGTPSPRPFALKVGETRHELRFPVQDFPANARSVKVLLIGTLPGVERVGLLCSNLVEVKLPDPR